MVLGWQNEFGAPLQAPATLRICMRVYAFVSVPVWVKHTKNCTKILGDKFKEPKVIRKSSQAL